MAIQVTPIPQLIDLVAPAYTLGVTNTAGSATTATATDSTLLVFDTTVAGNVDIFDSGATGSVALNARRDHQHGAPLTAKWFALSRLFGH